MNHAGADYSSLWVNQNSFDYVFTKMLARFLTRTLNIACKVVRMSDAKVKSEITNVRVLFAREIFTRLLSGGKLMKRMVARDGIEPPTPAFSGPRSTN
jgi:hypothetical protein